MSDSVEQTDLEIGKVLASQREHPWVRSLVKVGKLGDQEPLYAAGAGVVLVAAYLRNCRLAEVGASILLAVAAADAGKTLAKKLVTRSRPHVLLDDGRYRRESGGTEEKPEQSFPSGHVACTVAAARAVSRLAPAATPWGVGASVMIGAARLVKGAHWPLDVLAGIVIGLGSEALSSRILDRLGVSQSAPEADDAGGSRTRSHRTWNEVAARFPPPVLML